MTTRETEFTRSIKLLNELNTNAEALDRFENDPDAILSEFGIRGEEVDRFKDRWEDGDLQVLGWRITSDYQILSPWPMASGNRIVRRITPNEINACEDVEIVVTGSGFKIGDRVGFRRQSGEGKSDEHSDVESYDVDLVDSRKLIVRVKIPNPGLYDVAVGRLVAAGFLDSGLTVR